MADRASDTGHWARRQHEEAKWLTGRLRDLRGDTERFQASVRFLGLSITEEHLSAAELQIVIAQRTLAEEIEKQEAPHG